MPDRGNRERARALRRRQTPAEAQAWELLRNRRLGGHKFRRQHPIGRFIVHFYCADLRLVLEIDGAVHSTPHQRAYDAERPAYLEALGLRVVRIPNEHVCEDTLQAIVPGAPLSRPANPRTPPPRPSWATTAGHRRG